MKILMGEKFISWDEAKKELYTAEELFIIDLHVKLMGTFIKARNESGFTQRKLEQITGVKQPVIARIERGEGNARIDTLMKLLLPLGKKTCRSPYRH